jgi:hypothetical protein
MGRGGDAVGQDHTIDAAVRSTVPLPVDLGGITPAWATAVLRDRRPDATVAAVEVVSSRAGSSSTFRLALRYDPDPGDLPATLYLKGNFDLGADHGLRPDYAAEVGFYRLLAPDLPGDVPDCWFAGVDPASGMAVVLLEDLTAAGCSFATAAEPFAVDTVRQGLGLLARFHRRWWGGPMPRIRNRRTEGTKDAASDVLFHPVHWERSLDTPAGSLLADDLRDRERMARRMTRLFERNAALPPCFVHGDAHPDNWFLRPDGRPGLFDWGPYTGTWAREVSYFLVGALDVEDRRAHERELVAHYLDRLADQDGPRLDPDEAWQAFRWNVVNGLFWFLCPPQSQPTEVIVANTSRFVAAAADLDSTALLD